VKKNWHKYRAAGRTSEWKNRNMANNVLRDFKVRVKDAGIMATGKLTLHCLRKSWANAGVPSNTLMKMGGWSNIETVLKYYLKSSDENEKKAVRILDRLMEVEVGSGFVGKEG
jgi:integrase